MRKAEDLTNKTFGELLVIARDNRNSTIKGARPVLWLCKCSCDKFCTVSTQNLKSGKVLSCGCLKENKKYEDLTNKKFGRLTVIKRNEFKKIISWICECDCKKIVSVQGSSLKNGSTKSCGCLRQENKLDRAALIGQKYNEWKITNIDDTNNDYVFCKCSCGVKKRVNLFSLMNGMSKSCGHGRNENKKNNFEDLTGMTFGKLKVLSRVKNGTNGARRWLCECKCGNTIEVLAGSLKNHNTISCGCYKKQIFAIFMSGIEREMSRIDL